MLRRILGFVSVCLTAAASTAREPGTFDYHEATLDNGLRVITLEDFSCPIVAVHLWYHVGSKNENPERTGFAHMFEHMMFRGTDRLGPTDHFDLIRQTGGNCNAYTAFDQTVYVQTLPANQLELALWLEAERMGFLKIDQEGFDTERKVVEEERRLGLNQPYGDVLEKGLAALYEKLPYRWSPIGNIAHLRAASVAELRAFWMRYYVPNNATLVVVGAVKHDDVVRLAKRYFGWIPRYDDPPQVSGREPQPDGPQDVNIKSENAPAPAVALIWHTVPLSDDDSVPLEMLATILGGGKSSRLYRRLVADERAAVQALAMYFGLELDGIFGAAAVLKPIGGDTAKVLAELEEEVAKIRSEPVRERELEKARNQMLRNLVTENLTVVKKATALGQAAVIEHDLSRINRRYAAIQAVTADDLLRVARKYLAPEHVYRVTIERNLLGSISSMMGLKKHAEQEEEAPITAKPETNPPPPGKPGLKRPEGYPDKPPIAPLLAADPTPKFERRTLDNGLKVIVVSNSEVPYVTVRLGLDAGAWTDPKPGVASLAMQMLTRGTRKHSEAELSEILDYYAISLSGSAGMDTSSVSAGAITKYVDKAVELMAEVVREPTFPQEEFEKLRDQVRTSLRIQSAEPSYVAARELRRRLYGEHPYAHTVTGELEDVDAISVDDLRSWWQARVCPEGAALIFAGDITTDAAMKLAAKYFGDWHAQTEAPAVAVPPVPPPQPTKIYLVNRPGIQAQIRVAQPGLTRHDPDYFLARVVSGYFGEAFNARLNKTIRVEKGLTYGAGGGFVARRFAGEFAIHTFSKVATAADAVQAIFDELERLRTEPPSEEELHDTVSYTLGSFPAKRETPQQVAGDLWLVESQDLPDDYFEQYLRAVAKARPEPCVELARRRVDPKHMVVVVVGPADQLKDKLEKIAPVEVVNE